MRSGRLPWLLSYLAGDRGGSKRGVGVRTLMALVGHSNMETTQRYTDLRPAMLKAAVALV